MIAQAIATSVSFSSQVVYLPLQSVPGAFSHEGGGPVVLDVADEEG
jgi:hypothetical protein